MNYENSKVGNFTSLRIMVLKDDEPDNVHNQRKIKRKGAGFFSSELEIKEYKVVFKKRRLMNNIDSLPYGYLKIWFKY